MTTATITATPEMLASIANACHESTLAAFNKALDCEADLQHVNDPNIVRELSDAARAYRAVAASRREAFEHIMRSAPVVQTIHKGQPGLYHCAGLYRLPACTGAINDDGTVSHDAETCPIHEA